LARSLAEILGLYGIPRNKCASTEHKPVIAILTSERDYTATILLEYLQSHGVSAGLIGNCEGFSVTIQQNPDGSSNVRLLSRESSEEFTGVVNRLEWNEESSASEAIQFAAQETMAALWAALGLTVKPVVNRPSRWGFHPQVSRVSNLVCPHVFSTKPDIFVALPPRESRMPSLTIKDSANVYRVLDGIHVGRYDRLSSLSGANDVFRVIPFRRGKVRRLLTAGNHLFDLFPEAGVYDVSDVPGYQALLASLRAAEATFTSIVLEEDASNCSTRPVLLQFSPFPLYEQFAHIDDLVFSSLLSFLMP
jgi:hypothetical protein